MVSQDDHRTQGLWSAIPGEFPRRAASHPHRIRFRVVADAEIAADDPRAEDVRALLEAHLVFARTHSPPEDVHALDVETLLAPDITFFSLRRKGELLGVGALKRLDAHHVELKSMHTVQQARRGGIGRAMLDHLVGVARHLGCRRVSLETGSMTAFAPARALYARAGFEPCGPFGDYSPSPHSTFMTLSLDSPEPYDHGTPTTTETTP